MINLFADGCRGLLARKIRSSLAFGVTKNGDFPWKADRKFNGGLGFLGLPFNGKQSKAQILNRLSEGILALIEALRQTTGRAENDFLRLGDELQTIYSKSTELARQIVGAIRIIESEDGTSILQELQTLVRESLAKLTSCRDEAASKEVVIRNISAEVSGLDRNCSEAERMATYLTAIGFNIRIESAQKEEFDKLFGVIAGEIRRSSGRIVEIIEMIRADAANLCRDQTQVSVKISADLAELGGLAEKADVLVSRAFEQIEQLISLACTELGRAGDYSKTLTSQVGEIVMGIQLHDSMNQRIGHIVEALEDVKRMIDDGEAEQPANVLDILNLQEAQLQHMLSEVEEVYDRTQKAFESIGSCVDQLTGSLTGFAEQRDSSAGDPFGQLTDAFLQLDRLLGGGTALIVDIDQLSEKTAAAAGKLSMYLEQLQDISFNTRLIGLNSIVNAARLGEQGRIFEVMSNQLTGMTEYSDHFVGSVEGIVSSVRGHIEKALQKKNNGKAEESGHDLSIGEVVENSSRQYDRFHEMSVAAGTVAEAVKDDLARIRGELDFLDRLRQELQGLIDSCGELSILLQPWERSEQKSSEQYRQELAERYTMQQERDIHDNLLAMPTLAADTVVNDQAQEDDMVLLFDNEPVSELEPVAPDVAGDKVDPSSTAENEESSLGDNVDLF